MGRKNVILPHLLADDQSLASNFNSTAVNVQYLDNVGIQIVTSSVTDNTGQFSVEVSNDNVTYEAVTVSPAISALSNADTNIFININQIPFTWIRVAFVAAGGTPDGTCDIHVTAKEL